MLLYFYMFCYVFVFSIVPHYIGICIFETIKVYALRVKNAYKHIAPPTARGSAAIGFIPEKREISHILY